jgi:thymidylate synthase (FAD)
VNIEELHGLYFPVLDHGFCAVVDHMGDDQSITRAARCSYGRDNKTLSDDRALIRTLMRERHTSPFEMCEIVLHIGMPIFTARQFVRHRSASLNEVSGRYSIMTNQCYTPTQDRYRTQHSTNKQGSSCSLIGEDDRKHVQWQTKKLRNLSHKHYNDCLEANLAREMARIDLPLSTYTYWYWKIDVHNLLHFLKLRLDEHAQWEIRQYARIIAGIVRVWLPLTWEAFCDYVLNAVSLSVQETQVMAAILIDNYLLLEYNSPIVESKCKKLGMSNREIQDFLNKLHSSCDKYDDQDFTLDVGSAKQAHEIELIN